MPALHRPRLTVRLRLTLLYGTLFLASGAFLLALTYALVAHSTGTVLVVSGSDGAAPLEESREVAPGDQILLELGELVPQQYQAEAQRLGAQASRQREAMLHQLLVESGIALAIMAVLSIGVGWIVAGRLLGPLRAITAGARHISATNLHKRLALDGPDDEITDLGRTFDDLLGRLERSFDAQRQFVANASHELRTPLARQRTLIEVALDDPGATVDSLRANYLRVLAAGEQQARLIEALLTLARSERGLDRPEPLDLSGAVDAVLSALGPEIKRRRLRVKSDLAPAQIMGDARLIERLVTNLLDNALRYNVDRGEIHAMSETRGGHAVLCVSNPGPVVDPGDVDRLFLPFQRHGANRTAHGSGLGLGLSIVRAIVMAHGAALDAQAQPRGGLVIKVIFPGVADGAIGAAMASVAVDAASPGMLSHSAVIAGTKTPH